MEVTVQLQKEFARFCDSLSVPFFNRAMRLVIFEFMKSEVSRDDLYTPRLMDHMTALYRLLDAMEDEHHKQKLPMSNARMGGPHGLKKINGQRTKKR